MKQPKITLMSTKTLPRGKRVMIVSPHPDDTSIAVGGTAALLAAHNTVVSVVMTTGHRAAMPKQNKSARILTRETEARAEAKILQIDCCCLQLPLYDARGIAQADLDTFLACVEEHAPDIVLLPNRADPHPTHALCTQLALRTLSVWAALTHRTVELWFYESPWSLFNRDDYNLLVPIPDKTFAQKLKAIRAHVSQNSRTRYDTIATSLASLRAEIVPEQQLAAYGDMPPDVGAHVELFHRELVGQEAKLIQSFSGIRGIVGQGLTDDVALNYAYTYGRWLTLALGYNPKVVVGIDTRPSGPGLRDAIIHGLTRAHCHIFDVGVCTTPMLQFEVRNRPSDGGVMITASHNEPEWNGFKFLWRDGSALAPEQMQQVTTQYHSHTQLAERPPVTHYIRFLLDWCGVAAVAAIRKQRWKLALDPNGGAIVVVMQSLFAALGIEVVSLNAEAGAFGHRVEPTASALKELRGVVQQSRADLGVAWDCDGDRVELMMPNGELVSGHRVLALVVQQILAEHPRGKNVVINTMTSSVVRTVAAQYGAIVSEADVGEANVVAAMQQQGAVVGGEGSNGGGIIPPSRCRDGLMSLLAVLRLMTTTRKTLTELVHALPKYSTTLFNVHLGAISLDTIRAQIKTRFSNIKMQHIGKSWKWQIDAETFLCIRESQTEPNLLRIMVDSKKSARASTIAAWVMQCCHGGQKKRSLPRTAKTAA